MKLVERHIINKKDKNWNQFDYLSFISKNLYNQTLFKVKEEYSKTGKLLRYNQLEKILKQEPEEFNNYYKLSPATSQQILILIDKNIKSYISSIKLWKKDKIKLSGCPKFPKYKHKEKGRNIIIFRGDTIRLKYNMIYFPKKDKIKPIKTNITENKINQIRITPQTNCYVIEIVYEKNEKELKNDNKKYLSIDLGLNNLATCFNSNSKKAFIVNGRPLKSINQYYNKKKAIYQSYLKQKNNEFTSKRIKKLTQKRNNKISDYLHKSSRIIVDYCLKNELNTIVIGYNKEWKQNINLGKRNNQNFVNIPFLTFLKQLEYKCKLEGINFIITEESYTSKCSALDHEKICKHENYLGKRIKRGLYQSSCGIKINADLNGGLNILRKVVGETSKFDFEEIINRRYVDYPKKVTLS